MTDTVLLSCSPALTLSLSVFPMAESLALCPLEIGPPHPHTRIITPLHALQTGMNYGLDGFRQGGEHDTDLRTGAGSADPAPLVRGPASPVRPVWPDLA